MREELDAREEQACRYLAHQFLWPFDAGSVRHSVRNALRSAGADEASLDRVLAASVAHWRAEAPNALPENVSLAVQPPRDSYRETAGERRLSLDVRPGPQVAERVGWALGLCLSIPALIVVLWPPATSGIGAELAYTSSFCCLGMPLIFFVANAFWRVFRPRKQRRLLRREGRLLRLGSSVLGDISEASVELVRGHRYEVLVRDEHGRAHRFYETADRREARVVAIVLEGVIRGG